eukprot:7394211-Prorocentrum_lima.AAC.1
MEFRMLHKQDMGSESDYDPDELFYPDEDESSPVWRVSITQTKDASVQTSTPSHVSSGVVHQTPCSPS